MIGRHTGDCQIPDLSVVVHYIAQLQRRELPADGGGKIKGFIFVKTTGVLQRPGEPARRD